MAAFQPPPLCADKPERRRHRRHPRFSTWHACLAVAPALRPARADRAPGPVGGSRQLPVHRGRSPVPPGDRSIAPLHLRMRRLDLGPEHPPLSSIAQGPARGAGVGNERSRLRVGDAGDRQRRYLAVDVRLRVWSDELPAHPAARGQLHPPQLVRQSRAGAGRAGPRRRLGCDPVCDDHAFRGFAPGTERRDRRGPRRWR